MADLPPVLAGPILRRVDAAHVCVWIALSKPGEVEVTVFSGRAKSTGAGQSTAPSIGTQTRTARKCGAHPFVAVVDVTVTGMPPLTRHSYDVVVDVGEGPKGLQALGILREGPGTPKPLALGYADDMLPGFVTPAGDIADIRIAHSS